MNEGWAQVYLGVGSSLDPERNIRIALSELSTSSDVEVAAISTFYRTPPLPAPGACPSSVQGDPEFMNGVLHVRTLLTATALATFLAGIEERTGRVRTENAYAPRTMDLDILLYDRDPPLEVTPFPVHGDVLARAWVALPLLELNRELRLPPQGTRLVDVAAQFPDPGGRPDLPFTQELRTAFL